MTYLQNLSLTFPSQEAIMTHLDQDSSTFNLPQKNLIFPSIATEFANFVIAQHSDSTSPVESIAQSILKRVTIYMPETVTMDDEAFASVGVRLADGIKRVGTFSNTQP